MIDPVISSPSVAPSPGAAVAGPNAPGAAPTPAPPAVPDYALLRRIGVGGYGEVWLARSTATGALRAVKIVYRASFTDARPFLREFEGLLKFETVSRAHPSQLALFHVGRNEDAGWFYYVMELADPAQPPSQIEDPQSAKSGGSYGPSANLDPATLLQYSPRTLRSDLENGRLPAARVLEIGRALAEALVHLHGQGLVHRDVKPSNIIFVAGQPKLADIGLVTDASDVRSMVGTEGYLPLEGPGTPATDIFALGKVLYEALTGLDRRQFPELPADLRQWPDAALAFELIAVVIKSCAADARERYPSVEAMRIDLARLTTGGSVKRHRAWIRGTKLVSSAVGLIALVTLVVLGGRRWIQSDRQQNSTEVSIGWTTNRDAADTFTKATLFWGNDVPERNATVGNLLEQSVRIDPNFALAHAAIAMKFEGDACNDRQPLEAWPEAERHLQRAMELEPRLPQVHFSLGAWLALVHHDWRRAEAEVLRGLELEPAAVSQRRVYALLLIRQGRLSEAITQARMAVNHDVTKVGAHNIAALAFYYDHQFTNALAELDQVDQLAIKNDWGLQTRAHVYLTLGRADDAVTLYRKVRKESSQYIWPRAFLFYAVTVTGKSQPDDPTLPELLARSNEPRGAYCMALAYTALGDKEKALDWLDTAYTRNEWDLLEVKVDLRVDSLRHEKRFQELLKRMNLAP